MTTNQNNKKKPSAARKLIPAVGMLTASAMMLASSTYAWFTMSREVEVSNISMSATVPEDIQISLGQIGVIGQSGISASTKETDASLANGKGVLVASNNVVNAPTNDWDWSNIADVSEYYQFGRLIPASSTTGANIFFTPNANGVGKTIASNADFYQAAENLTAKTQADLNVTGATATTSLMATAHVVTSKDDIYVTDKWSEGGDNNYQTSKGWNNTNDDGYYIDIPVWFRTSSVDGAKLSVQGYVKPKNDKQQGGKTADEALYRAVRVSIIDVGDVKDGGTYEASGTTKGLIPLADAWTLATQAGASGSLKSTDSPFTMANLDASILDWYGRNITTGASAASKLTATGGSASGASAAVSALNSTATNVKATYSEATIYNALYGGDNTANEIITLAPPTKSGNNVKSDSYGKAHKAVIRVWLEGEDPDCWNETAGQDWSINLKFNNENVSQTTAYAGGDVNGVNQSVAPLPKPATP